MVPRIHVQMSGIRLKCTKFAFRRAPDPAGELTALPRPLAVFNGPTSKAREGKGRGGENPKSKINFMDGLLYRLSTLNSRHTVHQHLLQTI